VGNGEDMSATEQRIKGKKKRIAGTILDVTGAAGLLYGEEREKLERPIRAMVARHQIPFRKLNGRVVFIRSELEEFINSLPGLPLVELRKRQAESQ
jgi:hypothetical protein